VIVQDCEGEQKPVYFVSRKLQEAEVRYQMIEKVALVLVMTVRRMRAYFQSHLIIVKTNFPIAKILGKPDLAGRMIGWSVELSEYGIRYEPRRAVKSEYLANFVAEMKHSLDEASPFWTLYVDESNPKGSGAGIFFEGPGEFVLEQSLKFEFKTSNNQAEYEALLTGLELARDMGADCLVCHSDSQLLVGQLNGDFQVKDPLLLQYYYKVRTVMEKFEKLKVVHVRREHNARADLLSKLASTKKRSCHKSVIQQKLNTPSVEVPLATTLATEVETPWFEPIRRYLQNDNCQDEDEQKMKAQSARYVLIGGELYRRGYSQPLLKCLTMSQAKYVMEELHIGICGLHFGARSMANRVVRARYYWPTIKIDCTGYVQKCRQCQEYGNPMHTQPEILHSIMSPWPFAMWVMDIIGSFPPRKGQSKFLLVGIDYFTKWIEAEPLATITAKKVQDFVWKSIVCRFGVPHTIVTDNGRQFIDQGLINFYEGLGIWHVTSSVEHPQTNEQAEAANKVILSELKKRLGVAKGRWPEGLLEVLWAYRCTPQSSTQETPYSLIYDTDAMIHVEVGIPTLRRQLIDLSLKNESLAASLDLINELRDRARIRDEAGKLRVARRYNSKVNTRCFHPGDLVWRMQSGARQKEGKFSSNWERPFCIRETTSKDIGWPTHTKDLERHSFEVLFQLNCISCTCNFEIPLM